MDSSTTFLGVSPGAVRRTDEALEHVVALEGVSCAMAIDHGGFIVASQGEVEHVTPEELASIAAASFASYELIVHTHEVSLDFHTRGIGDLHLVRVNSNLFILTVYNADHCDPAEALERSRYAAEISRDAVGHDETVLARLGSVNFISDKLDDLFKDV